MTRFTIGFLWYLKERNIEMNLSNPKEFTVECEKALKEYLEKYPKGLTNGGSIIEF